jgi:hypothetical protein
LPPTILGYKHASGEVHIKDNNEWVSCPGKNYVSQMKINKLTGHNFPVGQENPSKECTNGDVPNVFVGKASDHNGPYDGVSMDFC